MADAENSYRATLAQIFGGIAIAIGLYYTWRRISISEKELKATQKNLAITQKNLRVAQEGQITERFTRAVDQLGNPAMEIRLGGIYALERIANESEKDYWPIMEILTAYVRKNSSIDAIENKNVTLLAIDIQANESKQKEVPETKKIALDIQAVLTVLGRRKNTFYDGESNSLNLSHSRLQAADLEKANFEGADLEGANLEGANLVMTHLEEANLRNAHLEEADFFETHLQQANLGGAYLEKTYITNSYLVEASLMGAHLEDADFRWTHLEGADLVGAYLKRANLEGSHLEGSHLIEANLTEANLKGAYLGKVEFEEVEPYVISSKEDDGIRLIAAGKKTDYEDFFEIELKGANLASANLASANLTRADLSEANLPRADLSEANLNEAKLESTNFKGAKNLTVDQLSKVKTLYNTKLDPEIEAELRAKGFGYLLDDKPDDKP
ncbi:Pentapeptide repeat family protein [Methanosarcina siciliae HI350]|uniref:Pentapeptide repeat family protein n=2 Tax=Methanosarcina siciliae TaxID=38027 RepID=A0A0E3L9Z0_9EURY|nr:Pentapeptide repeat family protein [Methanosarcina siciliae HI350]